jgi:hypothetical protein
MPTQYCVPVTALIVWINVEVEILLAILSHPPLTLRETISPNTDRRSVYILTIGLVGRLHDSIQRGQPA